MVFKLYHTASLFMGKRCAYGRLQQRLFEDKIYRVVVIRSALEYVKDQVNQKKEKTNQEKADQEPPLDFPTPVDKSLKRLANIKKFKSHLTTFCEERDLEITTVTKCIGGLYHHTSKFLHGRIPYPVRLTQLDWNKTEIMALVAIFDYFQIPHTYRTSPKPTNGKKREAQKPRQSNWDFPELLAYGVVLEIVGSQELLTMANRNAVVLFQGRFLEQSVSHPGIIYLNSGLI
ncbi:3366_t:CDS:2 [Paraglomus occultum]|uniref:3366_t:CDS:1 n=1 Tax=Paraglomus occultum TaxID=144539 RepID=A0A9N9B1R0_9GLOM|nr:3366_t:CDS:2 [Paraglomus occultum]